MANKQFLKILFLTVTSVFIFANSYNFSQAADTLRPAVVPSAKDCTEIGGECETWCSSGYTENSFASVGCDEDNYIQNTCCVPDSVATSSSPTTDSSSTGVSELSDYSKATSGSSYKAPSLIRCGGGQGLCYDKAAGGCPSNVTQIADSSNACMTSAVCCFVNDDTTGCGAGGICVDKTVYCTDVTTGNCPGEQKCCLEDAPVTPTYSDTGDDTMTVKAPTAVSYPSQCTNGTQGCTHDNDRAILVNQCEPLFNPNDCSSMDAYLGALHNRCMTMKPDGIDCAKINTGDSNGAIYGSEAKKFADHYIAVAGASDESAVPGATAGTTGLDFDSLDQFNLPDNEAGVKGILVNLVKWMFEIIAIITLIAFVISGGQYLLSAGDETMISNAKRNMTYSIIGIIVALSGFIILRAIDTALQGVNPLF